jgi:hypothetical protein
MTAEGGGYHRLDSCQSFTGAETGYSIKVTKGPLIIRSHYDQYQKPRDRHHLTIIDHVYEPAGRVRESRAGQWRDRPLLPDVPTVDLLAAI